mmetsp:Transcript_8073/g.10578  ORF Transcript_8073/g.10578 Transcript_8073/m.10578 type:complete len:211 (-) Transcript_8073:201-833(-)
MKVAAQIFLLAALCVPPFAHAGENEFPTYAPTLSLAPSESLQPSYGETLDCPCWNETDLQLITSNNAVACSIDGVTFILLDDGLSARGGPNGGFAAGDGERQDFGAFWPYCATRDPKTVLRRITEADFMICYDQIMGRINELGGCPIKRGKKGKSGKKASKGENKSSKGGKKASKGENKSSKGKNKSSKGGKKRALTEDKFPMSEETWRG